ncbi:MAG: hypothetical protein OXI11_03370 [Gammaproteobacteria bacterium]|nr:hypothetical protein [Gammaproteobacteria bacterium]MXW45943.1 hypothetical protein [Gammaproteobacteria bacterium]MYD02663.1 hypothetical protein [Gammaproteobacteria bacterium]MYI25980.1 hypothetical protein [Gammaproteobacteria bacterium]
MLLRNLTGSRIVRWLACLPVGIGLIAAAAASGQSIEAARAALNEGRFLEAAEVAEVLDTSDGYALAAEALAIHGHYLAPEETKAELLGRAMQLGQEAIRKNSENPVAHLQHAHAMGRYTQAVGTLRVKREYAGRVRAALERALFLKPGLAEAHLSLGAWHAEAIRGGGFMARVLFGASGNEARAHYDAALELAPNAKIVHAEYALGLLLLDRRKHRDEARSLLERARDLPSRNAHDRIVHDRVIAKLVELDVRT